ncbi:gamma-aminobutyric acid receptor subunit theta [Fukomys damarensis]|uniref:Gamma-aminobutyric acid receptor subunit theta n=1 Tax=Fukomys damarensis TaxID=885580 RepID=A0A091EAG2_FUKDA|nr:gamma-aminobutyric acid receptor subunit theta [Fukomys damarensis]KFO32206.1 Gamma-aminobutyric acid receptor subunit theta [Fukomys damarensis]
MGFRAVLRVATLLLLLRTWLADSNKRSRSRGSKFSRVPKDLLDIFNCKNCANQATVRKILDRTLSNYDVRLRPNIGGDPVTVNIGIYVTNIHELPNKNKDYAITMYFYQTWKDSRLAYHETNLNLSLDYSMQEKLWVPNCYFLNSNDAFMQDAIVENRVFQLHPDGTVRYGIRLTATAACTLDLRKFPIGRKTCKLEVESYGYTVEDIILEWDDDKDGTHATKELRVPQFNFLGRVITSKEVYFYTGSYMRLVMKFQVQREINSYLLYIYWPTILCTVLSWLSFWMRHDSSAARVTIGLISILILTTIDSHLQDKLPYAAYIKHIDIYVLVCLCFVFLSLIEYAYINYLYFNKRSRRHRRQRRRPRRVLARYLYHDVVDGLINVENEVGSGSLPTRPAQAGLASPESLGSLATISEQAPLATSECLSTFSSLSSLDQLEAGENMSYLPSTSLQPLPGYSGITAPTRIRIRVEARICIETYDDDDDNEEESEDNSSLDESHGCDPRRRPMVSRGQRCGQEASWDSDEIESLPDDTSVNSSSLDLEEQLEDDTDSIWSIDENSMTSDQEKESSLGSEDSSLSPGCSLIEFSSKLFKPDYVPKLDRWCRVLFPLSFVLFNFVYWLFDMF